LPEWMQHVVGASTIEAALYRGMEIPGAQAMYPRPPKQASGELAGLIAKSPDEAQLYSLRALEAEQALDFTAAEADWKTFAAKSKDGVGGTLELADFYHRRLRPADEAATLMVVAKAPDAGNPYSSPDSERSWQAFERLLALAADQALPDATVQATYVAWIGRYPNQPVVYARYLHWLLGKKRYADASALIAQYRTAFPQDTVFPVKAAALVELDRGDGDAVAVEKALAIYDAAFQPLWPSELVQSFYSLLEETHRQRRFLADARERLARNPDDLNALARIFYYYQQTGHVDAAEREVAAFRLSNDARKATWSAEELATLAEMMEQAGASAEAARYDYALYHAIGTLADGRSAQEAGLTGMIRLLLQARNEPLALGQGNLSMYRDIATIDQGPGYWNGILSLWFNSDDPAREFSEEEQKAQPYFQAKKGAELLALLDRTMPNAVERPDLHAVLIDVFAEYGQTTEVIAQGQAYLRDFPNAAARVGVARTMADAYSRLGDTKSEFALYDRMLAELGAKAGAMPLTDAAGGAEATMRAPAVKTTVDDADVNQNDADQSAVSGQAARRAKNSQAFEIATTAAPEGKANAAAQEYAEMLNRYLGRLASLNQLPQALALLRRELDRNPGDPLLYERLADFLGQNNLSAQEEDVYRQAMLRFSDTGWSNKLARLYLREQRREAFADLTRKVTDTFNGTDLDQYFGLVQGGGQPPGPAMYLELNLYAQKRFPHDMVFVENLLRAYLARGTADPAAWEALLRRHWWESDQLRTQFFDFLSRTGKLDAELAQLQQIVTKNGAANDPAAARELVEIDLWGSHFEQSAPLLGTLAKSYPADTTIGTYAVSVFRSLAYYDASQTAQAVTVEKNLAAADPYNTETLATLGDLYAEQKAGGREDMAAAAPFWRRIPGVHPGSPDGYLEAATIFWDYFAFDDALTEVREARTKFGKPTLYGYEAGAIEEGKRDPAGAVAEYTAAALASSGVNGEDPARQRLLTLTRRPGYRTFADEVTAREVVRDPGSAAALGLRADVLTALGRSAEIAPLLTAAIGRARTVDDAVEIAELAQQHQLTQLYEQALAREASLASDPVQKMELAYAEARSMEGRRDVAGAASKIETVYRENPKILGVVRATADFYWRNDRRQEAIAVLMAAAKASQPGLAQEFTLEAANKANESGDTTQGRELAMSLLTQSPFDARYIAAVAESYARTGDNAGLKQFYLERLDLVKSAGGLSPDARKQDTVLLRRGLIPALTRLKDTSGAVDQYIAIMSAYPEDSGTAQEAALYALANGRQEQLLGFLRKTVHDSPQDSRFEILLAQTETTFGDLPAAIAAYSQAIAVRKDRADLYTARAELEERLQRFDEACADYERLYVLFYKDPAWMVKEAELRARQGRAADAIRALETAWVTGRPAAAKNEFMVAVQLEKWNLLTQAGDYAERGLKLAGDDLLVPSNTGTDAADAATYARIVTRMGQPEKALTTLLAARKSAEILPDSAMPPAAELFDAKLSAGDWRRMETLRRRGIATAQFQAGMREIGTASATYYTPEQKLAYAQVLETHRRPGDLSGEDATAQASAAGLKDLEAAWLREKLMATLPNQSGPSESYAQLQRSRMQFTELAATLEAFAQTRRPGERARLWLEAANAFQDAGDEASEMRLLKDVLQDDYASPGVTERYLALVLKRTPAELPTLAANKNEILADAATNVVIASGGDALAQRALDARGRSMPGVWRRAYTALTGLYFSDKSPRIDGAFREALDDRTIGERIGHPTDTAEQLVGDTWFYYGMRYGVYRTVSGTGDAEDYLPAQLERSPASEASYSEMAHAYADAGKTDEALREYGHALEITPDDAAVHNDMAVLLWSAGRRDAALTQWRAALNTLYRIQDRAAAPENFWSEFVAVMTSLGSRNLTEQMRTDIEAVLRPYIARNGGYRSDELLADVYRASATPAQGIAWILSLSQAAKSPLEVVESVANAAWLPEKEREPIYLRRIELARVAAAQATQTDDYAVSRLNELQQSLVLFYLSAGQDVKARTALDAIPQAKRMTSALEQAQLVLAAHSGKLNALLAGYRADPESAPDAEVLHGGVRVLLNPDRRIQENRYGRYGGGDDEGSAAEPRATGTDSKAVSDWPNARAILEYLYEREQKSHEETATDLLALADARLHTGDMDGALAALRRMTALEGDVYANFDMAAVELERSGQPGAAIEFLATLAKSVPWDASYKLRLAEAQVASDKDVVPARASFVMIAASADAPYELRMRAARDVAKAAAASSATLGSAELNLIASSSHDVQASRQPYFVAARVAAASYIEDAKQRADLLLETLAISPEGPEVEHIRFEIFEAEFGLGHDATAAAAIEPVLGTLLNGDAGDGANQSDAAAVDRAKLADQVATLYGRMGRNAQAVQYLADAITYETDATRRAALEARRKTILDAQAVDAENAGRRPIVSKALDQSNIVRPRVTSVELAQRQVQP
jgi:tetratricopeptide (TPR) repeat protein